MSPQVKITSANLEHKPDQPQSLRRNHLAASRISATSCLVHFSPLLLPYSSFLHSQHLMYKPILKDGGLTGKNTCCKSWRLPYFQTQPLDDASVCTRAVHPVSYALCRLAIQTPFEAFAGRIKRTNIMTQSPKTPERTKWWPKC